MSRNYQQSEEFRRADQRFGVPSDAATWAKRMQAARLVGRAAAQRIVKDLELSAEDAEHIEHCVAHAILDAEVPA